MCICTQHLTNYANKILHSQKSYYFVIIFTFLGNFPNALGNTAGIAECNYHHKLLLFVL